MKKYAFQKNFIPILCCPSCRGTLSVDSGNDNKTDIIQGELQCDCCNSSYPIIDGIPYLLPDKLRAEILRENNSCNTNQSNQQLHTQDKLKIDVAQNWAYQFGDTFPVSIEQINTKDGFHAKQAFYNFCGLTEGSLKDKIVGVYCGGSGREAFHVSQENPKLFIVMDMGRHIHCIPELIEKNSDQMLLICCDATNAPIVDNTFDISICDHALQHIQNYQEAYKNFVRASKQNGIISICVYSHENNWIMTKLIEPAKKFLHILPLSILKHFSSIPAAILFLYGKILSFCPNIFKNFPYYDLMILWSSGGFKKFHEACFDLMHAPISHHYTRQEVEHMAQANQLKILLMKHTNKTMWTSVCIKP